MRTSGAGLVVLLVSALPLPAQGTTVPVTMAGVEGGSGSSIPFGLGQPVRYMVVCDAQELPWTGPRLISAIALRADNAIPGTTTFNQQQYVDLTLRMSTSSVRAENASAAFEDNHGVDVTTVIGQARIVLPAQPPMAGPRPANIVLQFTQPWYYGLTPARSGQPAPSSLVVDLQINLQPSGTYRLDNLGGCNSQLTPFGNHDPVLCQTSRPAALALQGDPSMVGGSNYSYHVSGMAPNSLFGVLINLRSQGQFLGRQVPVALFDPLNPTAPNPNLGLPFAAPGCWVNLQILTILIGTGSASGDGIATMQVPAGRRFVGQSVYAQAAVFDLSANPLFFVTSAGERATMCGPLGVARIYATGSAPTSGQVSFGQGPIFEVQ